MSLVLFSLKQHVFRDSILAFIRVRYRAGIV